MNPKVMWSIAAYALQWWLSRPSATDPQSGAHPPTPSTGQATTKEESAVRAQLLHDPRSLGANNWQEIQSRYNRSLDAVGRGDTTRAIAILRGHG